jgi:hypothetical protein
MQGVKMKNHDSQDSSRSGDADGQKRRDDREMIGAAKRIGADIADAWDNVRDGRSHPLDEVNHGCAKGVIELLSVALGRKGAAGACAAVALRNIGRQELERARKPASRGNRDAEEHPESECRYTLQRAAASAKLEASRRRLRQLRADVGRQA